MSPMREHEQYGPLFSEIAQSFRPLAAAEREGIQVTRLRVIRARGDETLTQLIRRTGSAWTPQEAAIANNLKSETRLKDGQLVKVALREPYTSLARH